MSHERVLLPTNVVPLHYFVHLTPNFSDFKYTGVQSVTVAVKQSTKHVTVNALDLTISKATILFGQHKELNGDVTIDKQTETAKFTFPEELPVGEATLRLEFTGELKDNLSGFYRSKSQHNGTTHWLGTTQFEPVDARKAFPCWDEPALKAKFTISLTANEELTLLSNMPPKTRVVDQSTRLQTVTFEETPTVSTYLIAFCVGNFESLETTTSKGIKMRVWTTPGKKEMGRFALEVGAKVIDYFSEYYGIDYPLPKQDMIAIPDFASGAMENWGLITYRETALLCDQQTASVVAKARIAYVVAHELAHQWFGNLVTMGWWRDLWLNEGFATFVGTQAVAKFFPEWDVWTQFISDYIMRALQADSLRSSHPIEVDVAVARKIDEIFDAISYYKGASVIRMIENFLSEPKFRKGLNLYLSKYKYSNANTEDLWSSLSEGSGVDVAKIMNNWVTMIGYPVITVEGTGKTGEFKLSQRRFLASGEPSTEEDTTTWVANIGVTSASASGAITYIDFSTKEAVVNVPVKSPTEWVKFNAGQSGFFRVKYSSDLSSLLGEAIKNLSLPAGDRLGVQSDAFALAKAGSIPLSQALALAQNYINETDYTVWSDLTSNLDAVSSLLAGTEAEPYMNKYMSKLYSKIRAIGWDPVTGEKDLTKTLRSLVLGVLGDCGDQSVILEAKKRFETCLVDRKSVSNDIMGVVYKLAVRNGDETQFSQMVELFKQATQPEEVIRALRSIGFSKDPQLIQKAIEFAFSDAVRSQDMFYLLAACSSTVVGKEVTWKYISSHWESLIAKVGGGNFLLARIVASTTQSFSTAERAKEVEEFFKIHSIPSIERTVSQSLESIQGSVASLQRNLQEVTAWLKQNQ